MSKVGVSTRRTDSCKCSRQLDQRERLITEIAILTTIRLYNYHMCIAAKMQEVHADIHIASYIYVIRPRSYGLKKHFDNLHCSWVMNAFLLEKSQLYSYVVTKALTYQLKIPFDMQASLYLHCSYRRCKGKKFITQCVDSLKKHFDNSHYR